MAVYENKPNSERESAGLKSLALEHKLMRDNFYEGHPASVAKVRVEPIEDVAPAELVNVRDFQVKILSSEGKLLEAPKAFSVEFRQEQDVLDYLPYYESKEGIKVVVYEAIRPVIAARQALGLQAPLDEKPEHHLVTSRGKLWQLPGAYILSREGETGLQDAADHLTRNKLGLTPAGPLEILGGAYFPSVGGSTELAFPRAQRVEALPVEDQIVYGKEKDFGRSRRLRSLGLQEVVDQYFKGEMQDVRLVECVFRLAAQHGVNLAVPSTIAENLNLKSVSRAASLLPLVSDSDLCDIVRAPVKNTNAPSFIEISPEEKSKSRNFVTTKQLAVQNISADGQIIDGYNADMVIRKGVDSVDIAAAAIVDGHLCLAIKRGVRPAIAARNQAQHPINTDSYVLNLEGIAGSLEGEKTLAELALRAQAEVEEETGLITLSSPNYVGMEYPSPGFNPERCYRFVCAVDPSQRSTRSQGIDETVDAWFVDVNDILALSEQGIVRDPRLSLNAHILKAAFNYPNQDAARIDLNPEERLEFLELVNSGSELDGWLKAHCLDADNKLSRVSEWRHLKAMRENEGGILVKSFDHPDEAFFFAALLDVFAVPHEQAADKFTPIPQAHLPSKLAFALLHDLRHYAMGDFIPYRLGADGKVEKNDKGEAQIVDFEEYRLGCSGNECEAVWYSDVYIPSKYGFEAAREIFDGPCLGERLSWLGIDPEHARKIVVSIERDGVIPNEILTHPRYEEARASVVDHLLARHVIDREHIKVRYKNWQEHPELAEVAVKFMPHKAFTSRTEHEQNFDRSHQVIKDYAEGVSPIRAAIARTLNRDVALTALRIGYIKELLLDSGEAGFEGKVEHADICLRDLLSSREKLVRAWSSIEGLDFSSENISAFKCLQHERQGAIKQAFDFIEGTSKNVLLLGLKQMQRLAERDFPYLDPYPHDIKSEWREEIASIELKNKLRLATN